MFISKSVAETEDSGARLAQELRAGDVIALVGELGAGKTQFVKGIARGLKTNEIVTSPTFTLVHEYRGGNLPLYHFDFYRLETMEALDTTGFDEYLFGDGVCAIEWADKFPAAIPSHARWIEFKIVSEAARQIDLGRNENSRL